MFKKSTRLSRTEFGQYFKTGTRHHFPHFTIITTPNQNLKVAAVVGKKVAKLAVRRNTLKRRVLAELKTLLLEPQVESVFIVIVKPSYNTLPRKTASVILSEAVQKTLGKIK